MLCTNMTQTNKTTTRRKKHELQRLKKARLPCIPYLATEADSFVKVGLLSSKRPKIPVTIDLEGKLYVEASH